MCEIFVPTEKISKKNIITKKDRKHNAKNVPKEILFAICSKKRRSTPPSTRDDEKYKKSLLKKAEKLHFPYVIKSITAGTVRKRRILKGS